jgi:adenylate cyclase
LNSQIFLSAFLCQAREITNLVGGKAGFARIINILVLPQLFMRLKYLSFLILSSCISATACAGSFPDSILHKPFGKQYPVVFRIAVRINNLDSAKAVRSIDSLQEWAQNNSDAHLEILLSVFRWQIYNNKGRVDSVEAEALEMIDRAEKKNWLPAKGVLCRYLGNYYAHIKIDYSLSLEYYISAYNALKNVSYLDYTDKCDFVYDFAGRYYYFRDYNNAKKYYKECWETTPVEFIESKISKMNTLGMTYSYLEQYDSSAICFNKAIGWAKAEKDSVWIGIVTGNLASNYSKLGRYREAVPMFETDISLSIQSNEMGSAARSMADLSNVYLQMGNNEKAISEAQRAYQFITRHKLTDDIATVKSSYPLLAEVYEAAGMHSLAYRLLDSGNRMKDSFMKSRNQLYLAGVQHKVDAERHLGEMLVKEQELRRQKLFRNMLIGGIATLLIFTFLIIRQKKRINKEKNISDDLLRNILPAETAEELKRTGTAKAKNYSSVTVLFTDFKNFSEVSSHMTAQQLVEEINYCYSEFDKIITKYNLEKIKTIGDSYMCAGGLPVESYTHPSDVIYAAFDMVRFMQKERTERERTGRVFLEMRIGINTGPVVAGIVGIKKFTYDIWGDTVNIASRMESAGIEGKINISESTYEIIKDRFVCSCRGEVELKNKGTRKMYFVEREILSTADKRIFLETPLV